MKKLMKARTLEGQVKSKYSTKDMLKDTLELNLLFLVILVLGFKLFCFGRRKKARYCDQQLHFGCHHICCS